MQERLSRIKKAYTDQVEKEGSFVADGVFSITDLVGDGIDLNSLSDLEITNGLVQEGFNRLQDMMYFSDFSKESWENTLCSLLNAAKLEDEKKCSKLASKATDEILGYLNKNGFIVENDLQ